MLLGFQNKKRALQQQLVHYVQSSLTQYLYPPPYSSLLRYKKMSSDKIRLQFEGIMDETHDQSYFLHHDLIPYGGKYT